MSSPNVRKIPFIDLIHLRQQTYLLPFLIKLFMIKSVMPGCFNIPLRLFFSKIEGKGRHRFPPCLIFSKVFCCNFALFDTIEYLLYKRFFVFCTILRRESLSLFMLDSEVDILQQLNYQSTHWLAFEGKIRLRIFFQTLTKLLSITLIVDTMEGTNVDINLIFSVC